MSQPRFPFDDDDRDLSIAEAEAEAEGSSHDGEPAQLEREEQPRELLTVKLLKSAISDKNTDDSLESDALLAYAEHILPRLFAELIGETAKGGEFMEEMAERHPDKDYTTRESWFDQSLVSHLLNGLLPTLRITRRVRKAVPDGNLVRYLDRRALFLFVAGYTFHDWNKFPGADTDLKSEGVDPENVDILSDRAVVHKILKAWIPKLGIDQFLKQAGFAGLDEYIDALAWIAANTQVKYGTHLPTVGLNLQALPNRRAMLPELSRLSDLFVSVVIHPSRVDRTSVSETLREISEGKLVFAWHQLAENRGLLTNVINNAVMDAYQEAGYEPLLFFPHGCVYLAEKTTMPVEATALPDRVVTKIKDLCAKELRVRQIGFGRDGKGMKFADYYRLFFSPAELVEVAGDATFRIIRDNKGSAAAKRSESLMAFQRKGILAPTFDVSFGEDIRIDQLAEFCDLAERKISGEAPGYTATAGFDVVQEILLALEMEHLRGNFDTIANLNEAIKEAGEKGNTGGVPLAWYYLAAQFVKGKGLGPDETRQVASALANRLAERLRESLTPSGEDDGWNDVRSYVSRMVSLSSTEATEKTFGFEAELGRYEKTKRRGGEKLCSLCSSDSAISQQQEAALLFRPQTYTNKQVLFGSQAIRHICALCSTETMLRQILMNQTGASGKDFEGVKHRYLFFYPTYFFTPETSMFLATAYNQLKQTSFRTLVRDRLVDFRQGEIAFNVHNFQQLDDLLLESFGTESETQEETRDRTFKIRFPERSLVTFFFMGIPPGRDATDTESWVMPTFLSLLLPLVFDVKVVASESPVPLYTSAADFPETVFLDAPHPALASLVQEKAFRRHHLLPALRRLAAAYTIHLDVNNTKKDYYNWGALTGVARNLHTTPLYVFDYLNAWLRKQEKLDTVPAGRRAIYFELYQCFDPEKNAMNHALELVTRYRSFYRAKSAYAKSNAILKPIGVAADTLVKADKDLFADPESVIAVVAAEVSALMQRVHSKSAEGKPAFVFVEDKWRLANTPEQEREKINDFAFYFVKTVFFEKLGGDRARLTGKQLNLLMSTCEFLYRLEDDQLRKQIPVSEPDDESTESENIEG